MTLSPKTLGVTWSEMFTQSQHFVKQYLLAYMITKLNRFDIDARHFLSFTCGYWVI